MPRTRSAYKGRYSLAYSQLKEWGVYHWLNGLRMGQMGYPKIEMMYAQTFGRGVSCQQMSDEQLLTPPDDVLFTGALLEQLEQDPETWQLVKLARVAFRDAPTDTWVEIAQQLGMHVTAMHALLGELLAVVTAADNVVDNRQMKDVNYKA